MKNYGLYTKSITEVINKIEAVSMEDAIFKFASIKKLTMKNIVEIFEVKEIPIK